MKKNNSGYMVVVTTIVIGILSIISLGVLKLLSDEMKDTTSRGLYLNAFYAAESGAEIALWKDKTLGYQTKIESNKSSLDGLANTSSFSRILTSDFSSTLLRNAQLIGYNFETVSEDSKDINIDNGNLIWNGSGTKVLTKKLAAGKVDVIPLFSLSEGGNFATSEIIPTSGNFITSSDGLELKEINGTSGLTWNLIGFDAGIAGVGSFTETTSNVTLRVSRSAFDLTGISSASTQKLVYILSGSDGIKISQFLDGVSNLSNNISLPKNGEIVSGNRNEIFLLVANPTNREITYSLESNKDFGLPQGYIYGMGKAGDFRQNIRIKVDNSERLGTLRYSFFSPEM